MAGASVNVKTDSLLGDESTKLAERLVYYDLDGKRYDSAPSGRIAEALKLFRNSRKAVRRSSGGIVNAEPYELVVVGANKDVDPQQNVRVRVRFRDFRRGPNNEVTDASYVTHTKTVHPDELLDGFSINLHGSTSQRFLLDFGHGAVPIHVVDIRQESDGETYAYFLELVDVDHVRNGRRGSTVKVRVYRVLQDVLRQAVDEPGAGPLEYQAALANYSRLKREGARIVPEAFLRGEPLPVPGGMNIRELQSHLRIAMQYRHHEEREPQCFDLDEEDGDLVPFGELEKH